MRIVSRYLISSFLATFLGAMLVLTFILSIGTLFKITDLLARGVPWRPIVAIFLWAMPAAVRCLTTGEPALLDARGRLHPAPRRTYLLEL